MIFSIFNFFFGGENIMKKISFVLPFLASLFLGHNFDLKKSYAEIDVDSTFQMVCTLCHGEDGKGSKQGKKFKVPDFTDKEWQASVTDEHMIKRMIEGSDNPNYSEGVLPLLEMIGVENPKDEVAAFVPKIRAFAK